MNYLRNQVVLLKIKWVLRLDSTQLFSLREIENNVFTGHYTFSIVSCKDIVFSLVSTQLFARKENSNIKPKIHVSNRTFATRSRKNYSIWKSNSLDSAGFFVIFNGFLDNNILQKISGNALKLYVFLGIKSDNSTGESYYTISSMAKYFKKSERTINNWINELEKLNLIRRVQFQKNKVAHTFLQPYLAGKPRKKKDQ